MITKFIQGILLLFLSACTCSVDGIKSPYWNREACVSCRMAISEPQAAAQLVPPKGVARHYDDLGCALRDRANQPQLREARVYMIKPGSEETWVDASTLRFAAGVPTPMGYGFVPAADGVLSFADVVARLKEHEGHHGIAKGFP